MCINNVSMIMAYNLMAWNEKMLIMRMQTHRRRYRLPLTKRERMLLNLNTWITLTRFQRLWCLTMGRLRRMIMRTNRNTFTIPTLSRHPSCCSHRR